MIAWATRHLVQLGIRLAVTLASCFTLQQVIQQEGYRCELSTLLVGAALAIIVLRLWMPWSRDT